VPSSHPSLGAWVVCFLYFLTTLFAEPTVWRRTTISAAVALPPVRKRPADVVSVPVLTGCSRGRAAPGHTDPVASCECVCVPTRFQPSSAKPLATDPAAPEVEDATDDSAKQPAAIVTARGDAAGPRDPQQATHAIEQSSVLAA